MTPHTYAAALLHFGLAERVTIGTSTYRLEPVLSRLTNPEHARRIRRRVGLEGEVLVERREGQEFNHWRWTV